MLETNKVHKVPFEEYRADPGLNAGGIKELLRSPAHYQAMLRKEDKETPAKRFGKLFHLAVLEPEVFRKVYVLEEKFSGTGSRKAKAEWLAGLNKDAVVVKPEDLDRLLPMVEKIHSHPLAKNLLQKGVREVTIAWEDKETGVRCKARPDFVSHEGYCVDLKTSMDGRWQKFSRNLVEYGYHVSAAHYTACGRETGLFNPETYIFLVIESAPPYEVAVYPAGASVLYTGQHEREKALKLFKECSGSGVWPGYTPEAKTIEVPEWFENKVQAEATEQMGEGV
jgi:hypothetical protein